MSLALLAIGTAVPATVLSQSEGRAVAEALHQTTAEQASWLPGIYRGTGIERRHTALPRDLVEDLLHGTRTSGSVFLPRHDGRDAGPTTAERMASYHGLALPLARRAAAAALDRSGVSPRQVTHLVTVSCTGFTAPGWDVGLIDRLGLPATVERTHVGFMGCHGALNGLRVARAYVDADPAACVLLCAAELCTLHYHYRWEPEKVVANALFADGAAAVVGVHHSRAGRDCRRLTASGAAILPNSTEAMAWSIGDHGFEMTLSKDVPHLIRRHLFPTLQAWLQRLGRDVASVPAWAIHPGGPKILAQAGEALGLTSSQVADSLAVLAEFGNMSSPTVLFILDRLQQRQADRPCVALGFGPGLALECALIE